MSFQSLVVEAVQIVSGDVPGVDMNSDAPNRAGCSGGRGAARRARTSSSSPGFGAADRSALGSVVSVLLVVLGLEGLLGLAGAGGGSGDGELSVEEHVRSFRLFLPVPGPERENARPTGAPLSCVVMKMYRGAGKASSGRSLCPSSWG